MRSRQLLEKLVEMAPLTLSPGVGKSYGKYKEATVALIFRITVPRTTENCCKKEFFENTHDVLEHANDDNLEILFIKRAERERDKWSGHVAFPGGFIDNEESDITAVRREVMEEVSINLGDSSQYAWLGRLQDRYFGPKSKLLLPHIFLYLGKTAPPVVKLEPKEVTAVRWINARVFLDGALGHAGHLAFPVTAFSKRAMLVATASAAGCGNIYFPCVRIPVDTIEKCPGNCGVSCEKGCWVVWGITFNTLRSLVSLCSEGSADGNAHSMNPPSAFWTNNSVLNYFLCVCDKLFNDANKEKDKNGYAKMVAFSLALTGTVYVSCAIAVICVGIYIAELW